MDAYTVEVKLNFDISIPLVLCAEFRGNAWTIREFDFQRSILKLDFFFKNRGKIKVLGFIVVSMSRATEVEEQVMGGYQ